MFDHHLQSAIVYRLALAHTLRFSELKPDDIDNKLFTYHLKQVITSGYVEKNQDGFYQLTAEGRRLGTRVLANQQTFVDSAESVLFLVIRRKHDGAWLLYQRASHPLIDKVGFMHCLPSATLDCPEIARQSCLEKTGLDCAFKVLGNGFFRVYAGDELESFTHFTLLTCEDAQGELVPNDQHAGYHWQLNPDFSSKDMLPNMQILAELYIAGNPFFIEEKLQV